MAILISNDNEPFHLENSPAMLINALVDKQSHLESLVTTVDVNSRVLQKIVQFCEYRADTAIDDEQWELWFFENDTQLTKDILSAAHWLDIPLLVEACCKAVARIIKDLPADEMQKVLGL